MKADTLTGNQLQEKFRTWLSPPDPSINHDTACKTQHTGTARWFIRGSTFRDWKEKGSLLWIRGNRTLLPPTLIVWRLTPLLIPQPVRVRASSGTRFFVSVCSKKFMLSISSAMIEDIKNTREDRSALVTYHYFDYKDASKRHVRGLLASLLFQLCHDSDSCWDVLNQLYKTCNDGSQRPSDVSLAKCLKRMVELPGQLPIFIIMDALDECPNTTGFPSPRDEVLSFVEDLVGSNHSNLFICITSRPEQDIQTVLNPLTSSSCRVALHEERGQKEDINNYVRSVVHTDRAMRRWKEEDKEHVINVLTERAGGM